MSVYFRPAIALMAGVCASAFFTAALASNLPQGFVYLADIDPSIAQDMRYAGANNFMHAPVPGYGAAECVLSQHTAAALSRVQADLRAQGYGLLVYDCYRPAKAVRRFVEWAGEAGDSDPKYYPHVARDRLLAEGYIGRKSAHSSGGTVDLTLVRLKGTGVETLPMGTSFDFFDPLAHTTNSRIPSAAKAYRKLLVAAMLRHDFHNYKREWWHFHDAREPFAGQVFDFDIPPKTP